MPKPDTAEQSPTSAPLQSVADAIDAFALKHSPLVWFIRRYASKLGLDPEQIVSQITLGPKVRWLLQEPSGDQGSRKGN